ncbi:MAG: prolyl oligopeptidase family serine peptidase [Cyclobacteriaceae bacterium]|nr:prolyl oligopeptidase family serine peptidase [Cyclobacteriaceae bacterium]
MKSNLFILIAIFTVELSFAQTRTASTVMFKSGKETIEAILVRPGGTGRVPAVVFQQGSGGHAFDGYEAEAWGPHKFYIEDVLLEQGYAVLYCNKRGLGNSSGNWKRNDFYGRAADAYAAVEYLRTRPDIDGTKIGIAGHSQGGWISQITAAQHEDIAFVICLAGPTVGIKAQTNINDSLYYQCQGIAGDKLARKMVRKRKSRKLSAGIGRVLPFIGAARYWSLIADYDNDEVIKNIKCPTLLLFAEHDMNVPPVQNNAHFNRLFENNPPENFTIAVMPGGMHGFYQVENRCVSWEEAMKRPFDPEFQEVVKQWLEETDRP